MSESNFLSYDKKDLLSKCANMSQMAGITPFMYTEGKAAGLKAFEVETGGGLNYIVLQDKCLDIFKVKYKGINISFVSKAGLVHPHYYNPDPAEFTKNFQGGMLFTCGLSNVGSPCIIDGVQYTQHGTIHAVPASRVSASAKWIYDKYIMEISGEMAESRLFGENLILNRTLTSEFGGKYVKINDSLTNHGFETQEFMILYHFNFGYPFLSEDTELVLPNCSSVPRDEEAAKGIKSFKTFENPVDGYKEQVFYHDLTADDNGYVTVLVKNEKLGFGVYLSYKKESLDRFIQWKSMKTGDYALGLEPSNCYVGGRAAEMSSEKGLKKIEPMEKIDFELTLGIVDAGEEMERLEKKLMKG
ncbi:MAG: aldose 1-epimerase family protein [Clostridia bacterium]|mgnify:CR=1 FL=1|jgi:hypothetical protein